MGEEHCCSETASSSQGHGSSWSGNEEKGNEMVEQIVSGLCSELRSSIVGHSEDSWVLWMRGIRHPSVRPSVLPRPPLPGPWKDRTLGLCTQHAIKYWLLGLCSADTLQWNSSVWSNELSIGNKEASGVSFVEGFWTQPETKALSFAVVSWCLRLAGTA